MWCCVDDDLQEEGGLTDEEMGGVEIHVRCIFEMDHPQLLPTYLYTFAEQVALHNPENKARHIWQRYCKRETSSRREV